MGLINGKKFFLIVIETNKKDFCSPIQQLFYLDLLRGAADFIFPCAVNSLMKKKTTRSASLFKLQRHGDVCTSADENGPPIIFGNKSTMLSNAIGLYMSYSEVQAGCVVLIKGAGGFFSLRQDSTL